MKLPFLKDLVNTGYGVAPPVIRPMYSVLVHADTDPLPVGFCAPRHLKVKTEVKLYQRYVIREGASPAELEHHRRNVIRQMCRMLYGPMEQELRELSREMWEVGVPAEDPAMKRIDKLIEACRGAVETE